MPQLAPADAPSGFAPTAVEAEQLRRLGYMFNAGGKAIVQPGAVFQGRPDGQSAVEQMLALRNAEFQKAVAANAPAPPPPPPPPVDREPPKELSPQVDGGKESDGINPLWALPAAAVVAGLARLLGAKGITRAAKGAAKEGKTLESAVADATAARKGVGAHAPVAAEALPAPPEMKLLTHQPQAPIEEVPPAAVADVAPPAALPAPSLTQVDVPQAVSQALVERARGNIRGPVSDRMPPPLTPRPVQPTYTAPLDEAADLGGSELAKAIRVGGSIARERAKSADKTARVNKKRPPVAQHFTPDRRVPQEEGERKSFNEVVKAIRETKNPPQVVKDIKPWLSEIKKDIGQPALPKKKPGPAPKPKYKEVPETAKALAARKPKMNTAKRSKRTVRSKSDKR